jgi:hypothetical protein
MGILIRSRCLRKKPLGAPSPQTSQEHYYLIPIQPQTPIRTQISQKNDPQRVEIIEVKDSK